jgi:CBS domain-containing protein
VGPNSPSGHFKSDFRPVSKLRPKKPFLINKIESVLAVSRELASNRGTAAVVIDDTTAMVGIITDTDITRRVAAKRLDPSKTLLSSVMTPKPASVSMSDSAMDALAMMIENRYRHLPVVDDMGSICGLLDIGKCLNDAISKIENKQEKTKKMASSALLSAVNLQGADGAQSAALQALLGPLMAQAVGEKANPSLRSVLAGKPTTIISIDDTVQFAVERMADNRKAALIVDDTELVGILSFKDVMTRVIAKDLPLDTTLVSSVMTPNPESLLPEQSVLEALQVMYDHSFLTLPVCEADGRVVGLVDVMDVIYGCGGSEGWRSVFDNAIDLDDASTSSEQKDHVGPLALVPSSGQKHYHPSNMLTESAFMPNVPRDIDIGDQDSFNDMGGTSVDFSERGGVIFKVTDPSGRTHRIRCPPRRRKLMENLLPKMRIDSDPSQLMIQFIDDEGDAVLITNDEDLLEATDLALKAGNQVVKLIVSHAKEVDLLSNPVVLGAIGAGVGVVALFLYWISRPRW